MPHFKLPLVAILRGIMPDEVIAHAQVLLNAGFELIEVPTNSPDWLLSVQLLSDYCPVNVRVGAGTVTTRTLLEKLIHSGARLMVTPNCDPILIAHAKQHGLHTCIGAVTPTEVFAALNAGADVVKIFPAATMGPGYVQALRSVVPAETILYAVGGITPENLADYLVAGCQGAGLGSDLYQKGQSVALTAERAKRFAEAYQHHSGVTQRT